MQMVAVPRWLLVRLHCSITVMARDMNRSYDQHYSRINSLDIYRSYKICRFKCQILRKQKQFCERPLLTGFWNKKLIYLTVMCCFLVDTNSCFWIVKKIIKKKWIKVFTKKSLVDISVCRRWVEIVRKVRLSTKSGNIEKSDSTFLFRKFEYLWCEGKKSSLFFLSFYVSRNKYL